MIRLICYIVFFLIIIIPGISQVNHLVIIDASETNHKYHFQKEKSFKDTLLLVKYLEEIRQDFISKGYLLAGFDSLVNDSLQYKAYFNSGLLFRWGNIKYNFNDDPLVNESQIQAGFNKSKYISLEKFIRTNQKIVEIYENSGYPFVCVSLDSVNIESDSIKGVYTISRNDLFIIDSVKVRGGLSISDRFVSRYIGILPGDVYNESKIQKIETKLADLPYVDIIRSPEIGFYDENADVTMYLKSKKANQFNGILGIVPNSNTSDNLLITGKINLALINSFKRGESISFQWEKLETGTQNLNLSFTMPYLYKNLGYDVSFELFKKDTTYLNIDFKNSVIFSFGGSNSLRVFYETKSSVLINTKNYENATVLPEFSDMRTDLFGLGMNFHAYDYFRNPRKGAGIEFELGTGNKNIYKNPYLDETMYDSLELKSMQIEGKIRANIYLPVFNRFAVKIENNSGIINGKKLFENELHQIGGLSSLRGFDERSIYANTYSVFSIEPRYLFERNSCLFIFVDYGFYEKEINDYIRDNPVGLGVGFDMDTPAGVFSLAYAVGKQFNNPFELRSAKIHFGYLSRF